MGVEFGGDQIASRIGESFMAEYDNSGIILPLS